MVINNVDLALLRPRDLYDSSKRNSIDSISHPEKQRLDNGQRERDLQIKSSAFTVFRADGNGTFEAIQHRFHHIHANATSGDCCHLLGGTQTGIKHKIQSVSMSESGCVARLK